MENKYVITLKNLEMRGLEYPEGNFFACPGI